MVNVYNIDSVEKIFDFKIEGEKIIKIIIQDNNLAAIGDHTIKFFEISGTKITFLFHIFLLIYSKKKIYIQVLKYLLL